MRIVLDTNVVLSALLWRGTPYHLFQSIRQSDHVLLFSSVALLTELAEVLVRPVPAKRLALIGREDHEVLVDYIDAIELVIPSSVPRVVAADADDDQVMAAAVAAQADLIVTADRALLALGGHGRTRIVRPADAVRLIGSAGPRASVCGGGEIRRRPTNKRCPPKAEVVGSGAAFPRRSCPVIVEIAHGSEAFPPTCDMTIGLC